MKLLLWLIVVNIAVWDALGAVIETAPSEVTSEEREVLVKYHNKYRRQVVPRGANIRLVVWDQNLAGHAQAYADKCIFAHSAMYMYEPYGAIGENIYITNKPIKQPEDVGLAVTRWYNEYKYYNYTFNVCAQSRMCGHYTQVVWDTTYAIGCGKKKCKSDIKTGKKTYVRPTMVICKYGPSGNIRPLFSKKPRRPYIMGERCSDCPEDAPYCNHQLCHSKGHTSATSTTDLIDVIPVVTTYAATPLWTELAKERTIPITAGATLRCFVCDGKSSVAACVHVNQSATCGDSMLNQTQYCARYRDDGVVKMNCMAAKECWQKEQDNVSAKCCDKDLCNKATSVKPKKVVLILLLTTAWSTFVVPLMQFSAT